MTLFFNHKLTGANFASNTAWFEQLERTPRTNSFQDLIRSSQTGKNEDRFKEISVQFDFLIGADGAHSATRYHMMKYAQVTYQQEYIDTLWCEFRIDPKLPGPSFAISPNHLHIWPAGSLMFIAIPSLNKSFTCTLFAPTFDFVSLCARPVEELQSYFAQKFPGVCPELISAKELQIQFRQNPHLPLISIKCSPYHYNASVVILGDAAHAMVPFYGQGMNAGLEDVRVLFNFLDKHGLYEPNIQNAKERENIRAEALNNYTTYRTPDAAAINDLALRNYEEMRSGVQSRLYRTRKWVEENINLYVPGLGWKTQYSRVSFENERYSEVEKAVQMQGKILIGILGLGLIGLGGCLGFGFLKYCRGKLMPIPFSWLIR